MLIFRSTIQCRGKHGSELSTSRSPIRRKRRRGRRGNDEAEEDGVRVKNTFKHIALLAENSRKFRRFAIEGREATFRIRPVLEGRNVYRWLENAFREIHVYVVEFVRTGRLRRTYFRNGKFNSRTRGYFFQTMTRINVRGYRGLGELASTEFRWVGYSAAIRDSRV